MAARVSVALAAAVALAWLAVMERDQHLLERGVERSGHVRSTADAGRAEADLRAAGRLNPDTAPDVGRAVLYQGRNRRERAVALVGDVLRREPENLSAWALLYELSRYVDPVATRRALAARRRLDPLNARSRRAR